MPCVLCTIFAHRSFTLSVYNASQSLGMMEYVGAGLYRRGGKFRGVFTPTLLLSSETSPSHIHHKKAYNVCISGILASLPYAWAPSPSKQIWLLLFLSQYWRLPDKSGVPYAFTPRAYWICKSPFQTLELVNICHPTCCSANYLLFQSWLAYQKYMDIVSVSETQPKSGCNIYFADHVATTAPMASKMASEAFSEH